MDAYRNSGLQHKGRFLDKQRGRLAEDRDLTNSRALDPVEGRLDSGGCGIALEYRSGF